MKRLIITADTLALSACSTVPDAAPTAQVALNFAAQINGQPFACGESYPAVGITGSTRSAHSRKQADR